MRKVIQIAEVDHALHALCDDGTMWCHGGGAGWQSIEAIPQPDDEPEFQEVVQEPAPWRPWKYSQDAMWSLDKTDCRTTEVPGPQQFVRWSDYSNNSGDIWVMIRAPNVTEAMRIFSICETKDIETEHLQIGDKKYPFLSDNSIPF